MKKVTEHLIMAADISIALYKLFLPKFNCILLTSLGGLQIFPLLNRWVKRVWNLLKLTHLERGGARTQIYLIVWDNPVMYACDF